MHVVTRAALGLVAGASVLTSALPVVAAAPAPVEQELFDSWVGKYADFGTTDLWKKFGLGSHVEAPLSFAPSKARYYDRVMKALKLPKAARDKLEQSGVVIAPQDPSYSMAAALYAIYTSDLPLLVTTDAILDAMHRSFDAILADLEENELRQALHDALGTAQRALPELIRRDLLLASAAVDCDLYLTVAMNLLAMEPDHPRLLVAPRLANPQLVEAILAKVAARQLENPAFNGLETTLYDAERAVDWSQFTPRGHYTRSPELGRYFRAMMWLGRADTGFAIEKPRELRAAAVLARVMEESGAAARVQILTEVVDLMVGRSDNLTPAELTRVMRAEKLLAPGALADAKAMARLGDALAAAGLGSQRIRSQLVVSPPEDPAKKAPPGVFQLFGQRFILDSFVLAKVVYDDIIYKGEKQRRRMPTGLDVMAALGNDVAVRLLTSELETWHYGANLAALRDVVAAWSDAHWSDSLYNLWLDALRTLGTPPAADDKHAAVPEVMRRDAWGRKMLQTQLGSWAELRHDTILYAKPSYTASVGCVYPIGYVEPYVAFYAKLGRFAAEAAGRFERLVPGSRDPARMGSYGSYFKNFAATMRRLEAMAAKELAGTPFDAAETQFLRNTIERTEVASAYMPTAEWNGWYVALVYAPAGVEDDVVKAKPTIADVHTDPDAALTLEVGTGNVDFVVAAIDNRGDRAIYVGPTLSYYEFTHPANDRLTDEAWSTMLERKETTPARPDWMRGLVVR